MNHYSALEVTQLWHIAGWTMLHSLWVGALITAGALLCRVALRQAPANLRYTAALACLLTLAVLPMCIATWLIANAPAHSQLTAPLPALKLDSTNAIDPTLITNPDTLIELNPALNPPSPFETPPPTERTAHASAANFDWIAFVTPLEHFVPYLPWLWIIGAPITFALLVTGMLGTKRLQRASRVCDDPRVQEVLSRLTGSLRIGRQISIAVCERIGSPVLVGILRPIILLPPAAITGWSPDELEMVLLHELAHVRRWDNLVNLFQRLIESLLFFHPAVWLVSNWVRREREVCCDAFVVTRTERPHAYAELLVALAAQMPRSVLFHPAASSAMAAGPLRSRIRRVLQLDDPMLISGKSLAAMLTTMIVIAACCVLYVPAVSGADEQPASAEKSSKPAEEPQPNGDSTPASETASPLEIPSSDPAAPPSAISDAERKKIIKRFPGNTPKDEIISEINKLIESRDAQGLRVLIAFPPNVDGGNELAILRGVLKDNGREKIDHLTHSWISGDEIEVIVEKLQNADPNSLTGQTLSSDDFRATARHIELNDGGQIHLDGLTRLEVTGVVQSKTKDPAAAKKQDPNSANANDATEDKEPEVVTRFQHSAMNDFSTALTQAYETARKNKQFVDLAYRNNEAVLVKATEPTEENWPDVLGKPPRKDRVIAEKAYARIGLQLAPLNLAETTVLQTMGKRTGVKIVGGNIPEGLPLPAILTSVAGEDIGNMDNLLLWLESEVGRSTSRVRCYANADEKEYLFDVGPPTAMPDATTFGKGGQQTSIPSSSQRPITKIMAEALANDPWGPPAETEDTKSTPTRNAQSPLKETANDRVVEAYTIPEDLVEAVRNYASKSSVSGLWDQQGRFILQATSEKHKQFKDLLKETANWREKAKSRRPDGRQIHYAIRKVDGTDVLDWPATGLSFIQKTEPGYYKGVAVTEVAPGSPAAWQDLQPGDFVMRIEQFEARTLAELESILKALPQVFSDRSQRLNARFVRLIGDRRSEQYRDVLLPASFDTALNNQSQQSPTFRDLASQANELQRQTISRNAPNAAIMRDRANKPQTPAGVKRENLRYNGKSFDQWRDQWQTELSTDKRIEAIRALGAFASRGYGTESAEIILEVAAEYAGDPLGSNSNAAINQAVADELSRRVPPGTWLPKLRKLCDADPQRWTSLSIDTLQSTQPKDDEDKRAALEFLLALLKNNADYHPSSLSTLVRLDPELKNGQVKEVVVSQLTSVEPKLVLYAVSSLSNASQYPPELLHLLLHGTEDQQQRLRSALSRAAGAEPSKGLTTALVSGLKGDDNPAHRLSAIRALAALGNAVKLVKTDAVEPLKTLVDSGNAEEMLAAIFALSQIADESHVQSAIQEALKRPDIATMPQDMSTLLQIERTAVFGKPTRE